MDIQIKSDSNLHFFSHSLYFLHDPDWLLSFMTQETSVPTLLLLLKLILKSLLYTVLMWNYLENAFGFRAMLH